MLLTRTAVAVRNPEFAPAESSESGAVEHGR